jgi:membrane protein implicated in regulation of membrane protease activity
MTKRIKIVAGILMVSIAALTLSMIVCWSIYHFNFYSSISAKIYSAAYVLLSVSLITSCVSILLLLVNNVIKFLKSKRKDQ